VSVGDQDLVEPLKTNAGLQDLALGTFTTIHQESMFVMLNDLGG
jgi:hypothetical protein